MNFNYRSLLNMERKYSSVGKTTGYGLDGNGSNWQEILFFPTESRSELGFTYPPIQSALGFFLRGLKLMGSEADHSPPNITEVKYGRAIAPFDHVFRDMVLSNLRTGSPSHFSC